MSSNTDGDDIEDIDLIQRDRQIHAIPRTVSAHPNPVVEDDHPIINHLNKLDELFAGVSDSTKLSIYEILILISFPLILALGQILYYSTPIEYFDNILNSKNNLLNILFVKNGWGFTILVYLIFIGSVYIKRNNDNRTQKLIYESLIRFSIVTLCWFFYTQWFFGLPIMDKIFHVTGGYCYVIPEKNIKPAHINKFKLMDFIIDELEGFKKGSEDNYYFTNGISSRACRSMKGRMYGGHDPSGHIFILSLSTCFLLFELGYFVTPKQFNRNLQEFKSNFSISLRNKEYKKLLLLFFYYPVTLVISLTYLWYYMFLVTSIYFHSFWEQMFGLISSYISLFLAYFIFKFY
ncbi:unnamed protein product [[Candida] boidinii]|uniref:Unnamed protein product n=1 Tax=Candida boidinii TaxID=5477 RepID=A0A9W6SWV2_CANBO|nr:hypothetical protein BVG19_g3187 [[Candida] boidinii]OWB51705.1 hypothetical protein B5S27_g3271 [[Candida] boidinii]OWB66119.1 hypothetical protein B5S30_g1455 [[Candida] boidinii]OWB86501.1 hypothetical protein B5S33_g5200 [[Candida] boidinii]GME68753.1 unnamed protein product [[Candida] boidinii]